MVKGFLVATALFAFPAYGVWQGNEPELNYEEIEYYTQDDAYDEVLEFEAESGVKIENNFRICIERKCKLYNHFDDSFAATEIHLKKKKKTGTTTGTGLKPIIKAIGSGVSAGGTLKIQSIKMNADGSWEMKGLEISAGAGVGADAPIPGKEDGKQVHHN